MYKITPMHINGSRTSCKLQIKEQTTMTKTLKDKMNVSK